MATKEQYLPIEQKIADILLTKHGKVLKNGKVDDIPIGLDFVEEIAGGRTNTWHYRGNGKVQIRVGSSWSNDQQSVGFRQLKSGGHSYEKIADKLAEMADYQARINARKDAEKSTRNENLAFVETLEAEHNLYGHSSGLDVSFNNGAMTFKTRTITQDQGRAFVELAIQLGIVKPRSTE